MRSNFLRAVDGPAVGQATLPLTREPKRASVPHELIVRQKTFAASIALCVQVAGLEEKEVYLALEIDAGHWTRIMKGDAHFPVNKLNQLMDLAGNKAPLEWLAWSNGFALVLLKTEAEKRAEEAELRAQKLEEENQLLRDLMTKR